MLEEIEEQKISSASVYEVASLLLGPVGTRVKLKIRRRNTGGYKRKVIYTVDLGFGRETHANLRVPMQI